MNSKISIVTKTYSQIPIIQSVLTKRNVDANVYYDPDTTGCLDLARVCLKSGTIVLISFEAVTSAMEKEMGALTVKLRRTPFSFVRQLIDVLKTHQKVAVCYRDSDGSFGGSALAAASVFPDRVSQYKVSETSDFTALSQDMKSQGITAVLGPSWIFRYIEPQDFEQFSFPLSVADVEYAIAEAERLLEAEEHTKKERALLSTILTEAKDGIIAFSPQKEILLINEKARNYLGIRPDADCSPDECAELFHGFKVQEAFKSGEDRPSFFVRVRDSAFLVNIKPIIVDEQPVMAILYFETVDDIMENEQQVRRTHRQAGNIAYKTFHSVIGNSPAITAAVQEARRYAKVDSTVLITGPSGVGKEIFAQSIHNESLRSAKPFVVVNCAALPESILESLLFGYVKGTFTGALTGGKQGLFEIAHGGTIFIDEIGELPLSLQPRFLRVIQEREVMRIGADRAIPIDVRIIAATNRDLKAMVAEEKFRADLYYRINVLHLQIPPLKDRKEDIPDLARFFIRTQSRNLQTTADNISSEALEYLMSQDLTGNVREMNNYLERAMVLSDDPVIDLATMKRAILSEKAPVREPLSQTAKVTADESEARSRNPRTLEKKDIEAALAIAGGNRAKAAEYLQIGTATLWRKMKAFDLL